MTLILLIVLAQLLDLLTFIFALAHLPIQGEINPLAVYIYANAGLLGVIALKVAATALVVAYISWQGPWYAPVGAFMLVLGLFGGVANIAALAVSA